MNGNDNERQGTANSEQQMADGGKADGKYDLEQRLLDLACAVIDIVDSLSPSRAGNHVAGQLVRCGTSPAANYAEAQSAESRKDFIHKLKIILKELRESRMWLLLIQRRELCSRSELMEKALAESNELIAIFRTSAATAQRNSSAASKD